MLEQCIPAAESYVAIVHVKEGWGEREKDGMDRGGSEAWIERARVREGPPLTVGTQGHKELLGK